MLLVDKHQTFMIALDSLVVLHCYELCDCAYSANIMEWKLSFFFQVLLLLQLQNFQNKRHMNPNLCPVFFVGVLHLPFTVCRWSRAVYPSLQSPFPLWMHQQMASNKCDLPSLQI